ncbi:HAMP domain-containing protein [Deferribacterales bacterium Es71-Z0220]|uniref:HAMP domain-containing protein n=1 Tax=Deferrivibrio essentukiensis TaxID=2880922 RepID=UPI001F606AC7|nr:HAMP domain-containing protein [Deferrivibrio essentukiensis]MCB4205323.1 HAMP domain-containing protein [Deferrivibrio essentukiensis]
MGFFKNIYISLEKKIFNSITKKLIGNFGFLIFLHFIYVVSFYIFSSKLRSILKSVNINDDILKSIFSYLDNVFVLYVIVISIGVLSVFLMIYFMRHLIVRPVKLLVQSFDTVSHGEGDLSEDLPCVSYDEFRTLSESYNRFIKSIRICYQVSEKMESLSPLKVLRCLKISKIQSKAPMSRVIWQN